MAEAVAYRQAYSWTPRLRLPQWLVLIIALFLAACVPTPKGTQTPAPPKPTVPEPVQPGLPTDTNRHRIALLVPTTGPNAGVGKSIANATVMALLDTKAENVRITTYDTGPGAAAAVSRALADGNRLILGPLTADDVKVVAPAARRAGVPVISFSNDASVAGDGVYLMGFTPAQSIQRVVSFARARGIDSFAALVPAGEYGERSGTALLRAVEKAGGSVVALKTYSRSPASMKAAAQALAASGEAQAILIADSGRVAMTMAPMVRANAAGARARLLGTELWNVEPAVNSVSALHGAWFASVSDKYYTHLAGKYRARFGSAPYRLASLGYDAVLLTVKVAQDWKPGQPFPAGRLTDKGGFAGIDGAFRFARDGVAERALEVQQVGPGNFTVVDAAPAGF